MGGCNKSRPYSVIACRGVTHCARMKLINTQLCNLTFCQPRFDVGAMLLIMFVALIGDDL